MYINIDKVWNSKLWEDLTKPRVCKYTPLKFSSEAQKHDVSTSSIQITKRSKVFNKTHPYLESRNLRLFRLCVVACEIVFFNYCDRSRTKYIRLVWVTLRRHVVLFSPNERTSVRHYVQTVKYCSSSIESIFPTR